ncbi:MAG: hypothetical protein Ta2D_09850 [Rickettsiales bacterium]|nr:MAG: hypothetical protein Ta2D_09850 [Rickettsiales bacterium]
MTPEEDLELYESITEYQNVAESMQTEINDDLDIDEKEKEEYLFPMIEKIKKMADKLIVEYVKYIKNKNDKILVENLTTHLEEIIEEIDIFRDEVYNYYRKKSEKNILTKLV